jgi:hypothetical protein
LLVFKGGKLLREGEVDNLLVFKGGKLLREGEVGKGGNLLREGEVGKGGNLLRVGEVGNGGKLLREGEVGNGGNLLREGEVGELANGGRVTNGAKGDEGKGGNSLIFFIFFFDNADNGGSALFGDRVDKGGREFLVDKDLGDKGGKDLGDKGGRVFEEDEEVKIVFEYFGSARRSEKASLPTLTNFPLFGETMIDILF